MLSYLDGLKLPSVVVSFKRAILLKGHCLCNGKVIGLGCGDAVLNFVQSNFMENVNGTSFYYEWRYKYIDYCKGNSVDAGNTDKYWILATAFTEESCLLRARQPSSMLDLAKGNEYEKFCSSYDFSPNE
ncbi:hypothetical protein NC652_023365 [Populus alba x Populus x berolinensis]|nr:hypothetical protein NC652_023365 [Populus alba x Populus x berolinensis]